MSPSWIHFYRQKTNKQTNKQTNINKQKKQQQTNKQTKTENKQKNIKLVQSFLANKHKLAFWVCGKIVCPLNPTGMSFFQQCKCIYNLFNELNLKEKKNEMTRNKNRSFGHHFKKRYGNAYTFLICFVLFLFLVCEYILLN